MLTRGLEEYMQPKWARYSETEETLALFKQLRGDADCRPIACVLISAFVHWKMHGVRGCARESFLIATL